LKYIIAINATNNIPTIVKYSHIPMPKRMNCRLNKLKATTPVPTARARIYKRMPLNLVPKKIQINNIPGIRGTRTFIRIALIARRNDDSNIRFIIYFVKGNCRSFAKESFYLHHHFLLEHDNIQYTLPHFR
jgi:hypothetical protein